MNWNLAKNLSIVFLVILNIFLAFMVYANSARYTLTSQEEAAIKKVLNDNGISLDTNILKNYKPMRQIKMPVYYYDTNELRRIFFQNQNGIKRRDEFNEIIFENDGEMLSIIGSDIAYESTYPLGLTMDEARKNCDVFMEKNSAFFPGYVLDSQSESEGVMQFRYRQMFKNYVLYSNYIIFTISDTGNIRIEYTHSQPIEFDRTEKEIWSPDEALFALLQELKNKYGEELISITKMDMVYNQKEKSGETSTSLKAVPCYRFYISNEIEPSLINAYTGSKE